MVCSEKLLFVRGAPAGAFVSPEIYIPAEFIDAPPQRNAKNAFIFKFHEGFLRVGVTKYCKLQYKMVRGKSAGATKDPRPE